MTPEERAVIDAARVLHNEGQNDHWTASALELAVSRLIESEAVLADSGWIPATLAHLLKGDRARIGETETEVLRSSSGTWYADNTNAWNPRPWKHQELWMDLTANPGYRHYTAPATPCEIWMTPERQAIHLLMETFDGTVIVDVPSGDGVE